jgi:quercetin dioxygenase-like cupin family protein
MEAHPKGQTVKGPLEWFTGDVFIDAVAQGHGATPTSVGFVHFTPGARTAWHSHSAGQTPYVTEGEGRVQSRNQPVVTIRPGQVIFTPGEEWHWHGAAHNHLMTHLAVSEGDIEWGEHVTDDQYRSE